MNSFKIQIKRVHKSQTTPVSPRNRVFFVKTGQENQHFQHLSFHTLFLAQRRKGKGFLF